MMVCDKRYSVWKRCTVCFKENNIDNSYCYDCRGEIQLVLIESGIFSGPSTDGKLEVIKNGI